MKDAGWRELQDPGTIVKLTALFLFLFFQIYLIFLKKHDTLDLDVFPNTVPTQLIHGGWTVGQSFVAKTGGLCRVDIMMGTLGRRNDRDIFFRLWEAGGERTLLRMVQVNTEGLLDNRYASFHFQPVGDSGNKAYEFILASPASWPENSVCAWMNDKDIYKKGTILLNNTPGRGDLVFRIYARRPVYSELHRIVARNPGILGKTWFLILSILLFECASCWMLIKLLDIFLLAFKRPD